MALSDLVDNIATAIDKKLCTILIYLNIEKAFDTTYYLLLLRNLGHYGREELLVIGIQVILLE